MKALPKTEPQPRRWFDRTTPIRLAALIAAVLVFFQVSIWIADAMRLNGINRCWSYVIVLTATYLAHNGWRALSKRRKAIKHKKWAAGLADGFAEKLEDARQEARRRKRGAGGRSADAGHNTYRSAATELAC